MDDQRNIDRISALPDALIHQILAFLDMREVVHTSILANRWKHLWLSTPYLCFDLDHWIAEGGCKERFMDFVDNILLHRGRSSNSILKFKISAFNHENNAPLMIEAPRVYSWVVTALNRHVEHLSLWFWHSIVSTEPEIMQLPSGLFNSAVKVLDLSFFPSPMPQLHNLYPNSRIKNLVLIGVVLPDGNDNGELILSCSVLKNLTISTCDVQHLKILTISTPVLEDLVVHLYGSASKVKVKIFTPQLKSLYLSTYSSNNSSPVDYFIEESISSLVNARIHICTDKYDDKECSQCVIKVLQKVYNVFSLRLSISTKKDFQHQPERAEVS